MNGAELLIQTAVAAGIEICFTNPGTTELQLVEAFDVRRGIRPVLALFEGCCSGAADGYARIAGKPAMTLFHLGPGLGNAVANLHNAKRARSPVFNVVGDHATWHRKADAPLTMDIGSLAETVSGWAETADSTEKLSYQTAMAIAAARRGCVATLIVPQDVQWKETSDAQIVQLRTAPVPLDAEAIDRTAACLRQDCKTLILLGGSALTESGLRAAGRIKHQCGCDLMAESFPAHMARGAGLPALDRIPYAPDFAVKRLSFYQNIVLAGAREPVAFFGYRHGPSRLLGDHQQIVRLSTGQANIQASLEAVADLLDAPPYDRCRDRIAKKTLRPALPEGALTPKKISAVIAALQPENAVVVDESITSGVGYYGMTAAVPPFSLLTLTGGAIGQGMPCATGASLACPDRPVINFQADGSAMYTVQSLWMQARESLNVTTLICANQRYKILEGEVARSGNLSPGKYTKELTSLNHPAIDWIDLSKGLGVPAVSVHNCGGLARGLKRSLREPGPGLIEIRLG